MILVIISGGVFFVGLVVAAIAFRLNYSPLPPAENALLEGATLFNLPTFERLLADPQARDAIKKHVVELGFNPCVAVSQRRHSEYNTAEAFLIDDGGGVHLLKKVTANTIAEGPIAKLESQTAELARLLEVPLRT